MVEIRQRGEAGAESSTSADAVKSIEIMPKLLSKKVLKKGSGPCPPADGTHTAIVHYTGRLEDGTTFDSSVARGMPFRFVLGARQVILAWDKGVATMQKGEKCELRCAPDVAYGSAGAGGVIPPNATLIFEVELLDFVEGGESTVVPIWFIFLIGAAYLCWRLLLK